MSSLHVHLFTVVITHRFALLAVQSNFGGRPEVKESWIASEEKHERRIGLELDIDGEKCSQEFSK
jgi:hypothetical protein